jgi:hypothetical protein
MVGNFRKRKWIKLPLIFFTVLFFLLLFSAAASAQMLGDVNDDGLIDIRDVVLVNEHILSHGTLLTAAQQWAADVNSDGIVNVIDASLIMQRALGLIDSFTAASAGIPQLYSPAENAYLPGSTISFQWHPVSGADRYELEIIRVSDGAVFRNPVLYNVTSVTKGGFPSDGTQYRWRVRAGNVNGWGAWSGYRYLTNAETAELPAAPFLSLPLQNAELESAFIDFRWHASAGANKYELEVVRDIDGAVYKNPILGNVTASSQTGFPVDGTRFRWRVRAGNDGGWGAWSHYRYFSSGAEEPHLGVPNVPFLSSPASNATTSTANIDFRWNASQRADRYQLEIVRISDGAVFANPELGNVTASTQTGFPVDGTQFRWRVRAGNDAGWSTWSHYRYFNSGTVDPHVPAPAVPILSRPVNDAAVGGTAVDFRWNAATRADRYELRIIRVNDGAVFRDVSLGNVTASTQTGFPNDGSRFRWVVRAGNEAGWSAWSGERYFTNSALPAPPQLSLPVAYTSVDLTSVHFKWNASVGATKYNLEVVRIRDGVVFKNVVLGSVTSSTQTGFPNDGTQYKWRVRAGTDAGWGEWSDYRNFTNGSQLPLPAAPYQLWPADEAAAGNTYIDFRWNKSEYANKYQLEIRRKEDNLLFRAPVISNFNISTQTGFPNDGTEYIWRVRAGNHTGWGAWSDYRSVVNGAEPSIPFLSQPVSNAELTGDTVFFSWSTAMRADEYELEILHANSGVEFESVILDSTSKAISGFPPAEATYKWRVRGINNQGEGTWSSFRHFTLNAVPTDKTLAPPVLVLPQASSEVEGAEITFSWQASPGAEQYELEIEKRDNGGFVNFVASPYFTVDTTRTISGFPNDGTEYRWRVRAIDSDGNEGDWSGFRTFTNGTP